jgi:murein DD-endopeptidase MepM/ murein hydrolase activator NlpD
MTNPRRLFFIALVAALSIGAFAMSGPRVEDVDPSSAPTLGVFYAAPAEQVETHAMSTGETLTGVLAAARITGEEMTDLLLGLRAHLNPRRLSAGTEITVRRWNHDAAMRAVEVRLNPDTTVRLTREPLGWESDVLVTPVELDTMYDAGRISAGRTLYEAMVFNEGSTVPVADRTDLVYRLAEVFEFKLDFTREIQPGDSYRLVYEREARPDGSARARRILAAEIVSASKPYTAVLFDVPGGGPHYYDAEGGSLRRGFMRYPIEFARVTSNFSGSRRHPVLGISRAHLGTDIGAASGTPVRATAEGTVTFAGRQGGYGNMVIIRHANGYTTRYAHLRGFAKGIRSGARVSLKQTVGYVGMTGLATGPHLHYELRINGQPVNPRTARLPDAPPLEARHRQAFLAVASQRMQLLDRGYGPRYAVRTAVATAGRRAEEGS